VSDGGTKDAQVTVTVKCVIAVNDSVKIVPREVKVINVLGNDIHYPETPLLTIIGVTQGQHGTVRIIDGVAVEYTHVCGVVQQPDKCGGGCDPQCPLNCCCDPTDTFTYTIQGVDGITDTATVTVTMDCPVYVIAWDDYKWTAKNVAVNINVLGNDLTYPAGKPLIVSRTISSIYTTGTIAISSDKQYIIYTPKKDYIGYDDFQYEAKTETNHTDVAQVRVGVGIVCKDQEKGC
jgi:hypothetical protein